VIAVVTTLLLSLGAIVMEKMKKWKQKQLKSTLICDTETMSEGNKGEIKVVL
jgi:hypothetical protein